MDEHKILQVPMHKYEERKALCQQCHAFRASDGNCDVINSPILIITKQKAQICPLGYWSSYYGS